jgi:hypothetical protein
MVECTFITGRKAEEQKDKRAEKEKGEVFHCFF